MYNSAMRIAFLFFLVIVAAAVSAVVTGGARHTTETVPEFIPIDTNLPTTTEHTTPTDTDATSTAMKEQSDPETTDTPQPSKEKPPVTPSTRTQTLPEPVPPAPQVTQTVSQTISSTTSPTWNDINLGTRAALVNVLCLTDVRITGLASISGSGVMIDPRGVILTNAHIGQYFLLKDFPKENSVNCFIRTGSPATAAYKARLLYIDPEWIAENANFLTTERPMGTGEHDYAFLLIDKSISNVPLPDTFPFIEPGVNESFVKGDDVLVGAYPAGFLGAATVEKELYAATSLVSIADLFTFTSNTIDVLSLGGSVIAQQGSSGGAVVDAHGKLLGLISTSSDAPTTADRDLRAISMQYIDRNLLALNKTTLEMLLEGNIQAKADAFNATAAPTLLSIMMGELKK